jgi:hypothetical protein
MLKNWIMAGTIMVTLSGTNRAQTDLRETVNGGFEDDRQAVTASGHGY